MEPDELHLERLEDYNNSDYWDRVDEQDQPDYKYKRNWFIEETIEEN